MDSTKKSILCDYPGCGKTFAYPSQKRSHFLVHSKEKPFACNICEAAYTTNNRLKIHIRSAHTGGCNLDTLIDR
ncbi:hypothetical protein BC830DRAFT_1193827 [Chytriomyces sp. MP71]|nr:hypothetical protein BC830DRAFT_1193827 [Chytriomyces sp. MP71]